MSKGLAVFIVAPLWPQKTWFPDFLFSAGGGTSSTSFVEPPGSTTCLEVSSRTGNKLHAWKLPSNMSARQTFQ